jgi:hypothetical protein
VVGIARVENCSMALCLRRSHHNSAMRCGINGSSAGGIG